MLFNKTIQSIQEAPISVEESQEIYNALAEELDPTEVFVKYGHKIRRVAVVQDEMYRIENEAISIMNGETPPRYKASLQIVLILIC